MSAVPPLTDADHAHGPSDAAVTLLHYGDFECPFSGDVHRIVADVAARFPTRVRVAFRHFPLRLHPHAVAAAVAAEAAAAQGAFWPMHDRLFAHPLALTDADLVAHAESLGLDGRAVAVALADGAGAARVLAAKRGGVRAGIRSTLALVIDGVLFEEDDVEPALVDRVIRPLQAAEG